MIRNITHPGLWAVAVTAFAIGATIAARLAPGGQASRAIALMFAGLTLLKACLR